MQVKRIMETCLCVDDLDEAEQFYRRVLGLAAFNRQEGRHVFFRCGPGVFLLFNPAESSRPDGDVPPHGTHGPGHVAFAVADAEIPAWREHLGRENVPIEAEVTWPTGGRSLYFRDPAGNSVELVTPRTWELPDDC